MTDGADTENAAANNEAKWQRAHRELSRRAKARAGLDLEEGRWLLAALRSRTHVRLGFGSFVDYVERLFGYVPRLTQEKLRVAEALEQLPEATSALQNGQTCWSALRELTRWRYRRQRPNGSRRHAGERCEKSKSWFRVMPAEVVRAIREKSDSSVMFYASRFRAMSWRYFVKLWPSCAAMPVRRSTMTTRCS